MPRPSTSMLIIRSVSLGEMLREITCSSKFSVEV